MYHNTSDLNLSTISQTQLLSEDHKWRYEFGDWKLATKSLTANDVLSICQKAQQQQAAIDHYPLDLIFNVLEKVAALWQDPNSFYRVEALKQLPLLTGFSLEMVRLGLDELASMLNPKSLEKKLRTELRGVPRSQGYHWDADDQRLLQYRPLGTILHVLSGNVFLVGVGSWLQGLLTGNVSLLKMSSQENFFMPLFLHSVQSVDKDQIISRSVCLLDYPSSASDLIQTLVSQVDGIALWGGEEAVKAYRSHALARTRVIVFGPKLSFSLVTRDGIREIGLENISTQLALEMSIWDQNACTAPQLCYVQGHENAHALMDHLPKALEKLQATWPAGDLSADAATEIRKIRGVAEVAEAKGEGVLRDSGLHNLNWTVLLTTDLDLQPSPLHRTLRVVPFNEPSQIYEVLKNYRGYTQTVGLAACQNEWLKWTSELSALGLQRILPLGQMAGGSADDPHDGQYDLPLFLDLKVIRPRNHKNQSGVFSAWDFYQKEDRQKYHEQKWRELIKAARQSEFYFRRLKNFEFKNLQDVQRIPILTREEWESNMLPYSSQLQTRPDQGGYVTRSGGSTGAPKFSYFDQQDWEAMSQSAVRMFRHVGLCESDRLANFMMAGDLYGSFISFNHINYQLGLQSFCFGGATDPEVFLRVAKDFKINAAQGVAPTLMKILRGAQSIDSQFKLEKIMYAGQAMSLTDKEWLRQTLGVQLISSIIGTTEANQLAYQCPYLSGDEHHICDDYNYFEIINEENEVIVGEEVGRLLVTGLHKHNYPVLRYLIGDGARWVNKKCRCGSQDPIIEYKGRWDDIISLGLLNIKRADLLRAMEGLPVSEMQIVARYKNTTDVLELRIESTAVEKEWLKEKILKQIKLAVPLLAQHIHENYLLLNIEIVGVGTLKRDQRTGKLKAIIDERVQHV